LVLYARRPEAIADWLSKSHSLLGGECTVRNVNDFGSDRLDVVINSIGAGSPARVRALGASILRITEEWDNRVLDYLERFPDVLYVYLSSGAIYGTDFFAPGRSTSELRIRPNNLETEAYYGLAKLNAEVKHRGLQKLNIADIRVFGYFSQFIDLFGGFFLAELAQCVQSKKRFITTPNDMIRDYADPQHLGELIRCCMNRRSMNTAVDLYTKAPTGKFELLDAVSKSLGLVYEVRGSAVPDAPTGSKPCYYSQYYAAEELGYAPRSTSQEIVLRELSVLAESRH
jgi:nucleoside-diphosphate-sugar epimerase